MSLKCIYKVFKITLFLFFSHSTLFSQPTEKKTDIYSTVHFEQQIGATNVKSNLKEEISSESFWIYNSFPSIKIGKKKIFSALEIDLLKKDIFSNNKKLNDGIFQRYGLFIGSGLLNSKKQKSAFYIGGGIATDFSRVEKNSHYLHLIYDHHWLISPKFEFGLGVLLTYNSGSWKDPQLINLLPTIKWYPSKKLNILISWDNLKIRQYLTSNITGIMEVRYDMSFFRLTSKETIYFENVNIGTGLDIKLFHNFYMQLRYKEQIYNNDYILNTKNNSKLSFNQSSGRALGFSIVYAK